MESLAPGPNLQEVHKPWETLQAFQPRFSNKEITRKHTRPGNLQMKHTWEIRQPVGRGDLIQILLQTRFSCILTFLRLGLDTC